MNKRNLGKNNINTYINFFLCPFIKTNGTNKTNMNSKVAVDAGAFNTNENTKISRSPTRAYKK